MGTSDRLVSGFSLFHCGLWQLINTSREENRSSDSQHSYEWARGLSYCNFPLRLYPENEQFLFLFPAAVEVIRLHRWTWATPPHPFKYTHTYTQAFRQSMMAALRSTCLPTCSYYLIHFYWIYFEKLTWNLSRKYRHTQKQNKSVCCNVCTTLPS